LLFGAMLLDLAACRLYFGVVFNLKALEQELVNVNA
jgi:hypothetical protein